MHKNRFLSAALPALLCLAVFPAAASDLVTRTAAVHAEDKPVASPAATTAPVAEVIAENVVYATIEGEKISGYLARPANASGDLPGLIVIHEWWGLNDNIRSMAQRLAAEGYVALAVDLYHGGTAQTPKEAMGLMTKLNESMPIAEQNLRAAYAYLNDELGAPKIGSIGWCLGGRWSLKTALYMPESIDAMVMYYGSVVTDEVELATLNMPILGNFAEKDPLIPLDDVNAFSSTLDKLGKNVDVKIYADAGHGFSNPSGMAYNADAAQDAWQRSTAFLAAHLQSD